MTVLYVSADVEAVRDLWSRSGALAGREVHAQLSLYADALRAAYGAKDLSADVLVKNWWRPSIDGRLSTELGEREARLIAARDHGFDAWSSVAGECDERFERGVEAVIEGRTTAGADRTARLTAYGGSYDVLQMLRTSGHPRAAGVAEQLERELARA